VVEDTAERGGKADRGNNRDQDKRAVRRVRSKQQNGKSRQRQCGGDENNRTVRTKASRLFSEGEGGVCHQLRRCVGNGLGHSRSQTEGSVYKTRVNGRTDGTERREGGENEGPAGNDQKGAEQTEPGFRGAHQKGGAKKGFFSMRRQTSFS